MMTAPLIHTPVVSAERPAVWQPAEMALHPWAAEVHSLVVSARDSSLLLDMEVTASGEERMVERWHLCFQNVAAFKQDSVGSPGNPHLTRYDWSLQLAAPPTAFWVIDSSEWLPSCGTTAVDPGSLTHFVVFETTRHRAWHIAACACTAWLVEAGEHLWLSEHALLVDAAPVEAGR